MHLCDRCEMDCDCERGSAQCEHLCLQLDDETLMKTGVVPDPTQYGKWRSYKTTMRVWDSREAALEYMAGDDK